MSRLPLVLPLLALLGGTLLSACEQEGPAEEAGEHIDNAVDQAGDAIEDAGDELDD